MKKKTEQRDNSTPLFDEVAYNKIIKSIDDQLAKLYSLQTEIMTERAKARGTLEAEERQRAAEGRRMLSAIKMPRLPKAMQPAKKEAPKKQTGAKKQPAKKKPA